MGQYVGRQGTVKERSSAWWERVYRLFESALAVKSSERAAFLDKACRDDTELRTEVESLLDAHHRAPTVFLGPAGLATGLPRRSNLFEPEVGTYVGRYKITRFVAEGGMGRATNGDCLALMPPFQSVVFPRPVRKIKVSSASGRLWVDDLTVN